MASLSHEDRHRPIVLRARTLIGRSPAVDVFVDQRDISREHAVIAWNTDHWEVRDLGSRNGTAVNGTAVQPGHPHRLKTGDALSFGSRSKPWRLDDDTPPTLAARAGDTVRVALDGLLTLPSEDDPRVVVHHEPRLGWVAERDDQCTSVRDRDTVAIDDTAWELLLPHASAPTGHWDDGRTIDALRLEFGVSADEEYVELTAVVGDQRIVLPSRAHHYTLLTLARSRMRDAAEGGPEAEHGWVYTSDLQRMLRASSNQLYVAVHRARKELEAIDIVGASELVQRRTTTRQLRLGVADLTVRTL